MEPQVELKESIPELFATFKPIAPERDVACEALPAETDKGGALSGKVKRLMASPCATASG